MKNTFNKTEQVKKNSFLMGRQFFLAVTFFILALLLFAALSTMAQTPEAPETFNVTRNGKEVVLTKDRWMKIADLSVVSDSSAIRLKWTTKNFYGKGVYAVMRSEDGINYSYMFLLPAAQGKNALVVQNDCGNRQSYYRVLYINERNTFCLSESKDSSDLVKETMIQQP